MPLWTFFGLHKGRASTSWPLRGEQDGQENVLGMPRFEPERCGNGCAECAAVCPTRAIRVRNGHAGSDTLEVDYGRCVACQLCTEACPAGAAVTSSDWALAVRDRASLLLSCSAAAPGAEAAPEAGNLRNFRRSLHIRHVDAGSCNGCESELQALNNPFYNLHRLGIFFTPSPRFADLLLVTGPVTYAMHDPVLRTYQAMPEPRWVMAAGTCAVSGGVAGGSYACSHGLEGVVPVDIHLPGCPPNPAAFIHALLLLLERVPQRSEGGRHGG